MRPLSHFGAYVAALAVGLALATAGGMSYLASAPTIPATDVARHAPALRAMVAAVRATGPGPGSTGGTSRSGR